MSCDSSLVSLSACFRSPPSSAEGGSILDLEVLPWLVEGSTTVLQKRSFFYSSIAKFGVIFVLSLTAWNSPVLSHDNPSTNDSKILIGDVFSAIGAGIALATFALGVYQYAEAQKWKRAEFVAEKFKEFEADAKIKNVLLMLDYNRRKIRFSDEEWVEVSDDDLCRALDLGNGQFTEKQGYIRDAFSQFFDRLEYFESFIEAGLVTPKEIAPYLSYWLNIIGNPKSGRKPNLFYQSLDRFLHDWDYVKVRTLLGRYGYQLSEKR